MGDKPACAAEERTCSMVEPSSTLSAAAAFVASSQRVGEAQCESGGTVADCAAQHPSSGVQTGAYSVLPLTSRMTRWLDALAPAPAPSASERLASAAQAAADTVQGAAEAVHLQRPRPRLAVRAVRLAARDRRVAAAAALALLVLLIRLLAIPFEQWAASWRSVSSLLRRVVYGGVVVLLVGPTCGTVLVWALVVLPVVVGFVFLVLVSLRAATS